MAAGNISAKTSSWPILKEFWEVSPYLVSAFGWLCSCVCVCACVPQECAYFWRAQAQLGLIHSTGEQMLRNVCWIEFIKSGLFGKPNFINVLNIDFSPCDHFPSCFILEASYYSVGLLRRSSNGQLLFFPLNSGWVLQII